MAARSRCAWRLPGASWGKGLSPIPTAGDDPAERWRGRVLGALTRRRLEARKVTAFGVINHFAISSTSSVRAGTSTRCSPANGSMPRVPPPTPPWPSSLSKPGTCDGRIGIIGMPSWPYKRRCARSARCSTNTTRRPRATWRSSATASTVQPLGEWKPRALELLELLHEHRGVIALRGQIRHADPAIPAR